MQRVIIIGCPGAGKTTFALRFPRADTIIFFDFPRHLSAWRALKRQIRYRNKLRPGMPPNWREHISPEFARFIWRFNRFKRPRIYQLIAGLPSTKTAVIFRRPRDAHDYLTNLAK